MKPSFLTDEHDMFRDALRKMLEKEVYPYYERWEEERAIPREVWNKLGENGFLLPWVDEKYGGLGLDFSYSTVLFEELEKVGSGLASGICLHSDIVTPYISIYGTEEQKKKWLPKSVTGEFISAIAMTEPGCRLRSCRNPYNCQKKRRPLYRKWGKDIYHKRRQR